MGKLILFVTMYVVISLLMLQYTTIKTNRKRVQFCNPDLLIIDREALFYTFLLSVIPVLLITFRNHDVGADTKQYEWVFSFGPQYYRSQIMVTREVLFWELYLLCWKYFDVRVAFFVLALLSIWLPLLAIFRFSKRYNAFVMTFTYFALFYHECFNTIRQMPALGIVFLGMCFVYERKLIKFIICVVVASLFHSSALLALPLYFILTKKQVSISRYLARVILLVAGVILFSGLLSIVTDVIGLSRFEVYAAGDYTNGRGWLKAIITIIPIYLIIGVVYFSKRKNLEIEDIIDYQFLWFTVAIYIAIMATRMYTNWVFRLGYYYQLGSVLLAGKVSKNSSFSTKWTIVPASKNGIMTITAFAYWIFYLNVIVNSNVSPLMIYSFLK